MMKVDIDNLKTWMDKLHNWPKNNVTTELMYDIPFKVP